MKRKQRNHCETAILALTHAEKRLKVLPILLQEESYGEILREAHEIAELSLEGILNHVGVIGEGQEQPLLSMLEERIKTMPELIRKNFRRIARVSDTIQQQHTRLNGSDIATRQEAAKAMDWSGFMVRMAQGVIKQTDD